MHPFDGFPNMFLLENNPGPSTYTKNVCILSSLVKLWDPAEAGECHMGEGCLGFPSGPVASLTQP